MPINHYKYEKYNKNNFKHLRLNVLLSFETNNGNMRVHARKENQQND